MREGKDLILATRQYAKEIQSKSWVYTISTFLLFLISLTITLSPISLYIRVVASIATPLLLVRLFSLYHDFLHNAILYKSKLARLIFTIYGWYTLNPSSIWKRSHDYHHKHNSKLYSSSIGSFPIVTDKKFRASSKLEQNIYLFIRHPFTVAFGYVFAFIWGMCLLSVIRNPRKHFDSIIALVFHFSIGALIWQQLGMLSFTLGFFIPAIISSAIGSYLFYAQHNFPGVKFSNKENWTYIGAALDSSSYMKMHPIMEWFTGNIGYHHIHHTNARIPSYRLKEVYKAFPEFQEAKVTTLKIKDIMACFRLKAWSEEKGRMLTLKEIRT
ncbi:MAG: fatty acid desaturase [Flavobacteriales bacterium]|nr:fatty acid desaturase [Flavobacteriales bacterium]